MKLCLGILFCALPLLSFSQDLIIKHDSLRIQAKVLEISEKEITFKNPENPEGPTYVLNRSEVYKIKYPNGTETVFGQRPVAAGSSASPAKPAAPALPKPPTESQQNAKAGAINTYDTGQLDALNLYNANGYFWGTAATTFLTAGVGGIVVGGIMAAFPPNVHQQPVSDRALLTDQNYRNGYRKQAYRKKIAGITGGFSVGITAFIILVLATAD